MFEESLYIKIETKTENVNEKELGKKKTMCYINQNMQQCLKSQAAYSKYTNTASGIAVYLSVLEKISSKIVTFDNLESILSAS